MNMSVATSSVKKGETLIDTAMTLNAMRPDIIVVRHAQAGAVHLLAKKVDCSVVNAGDGAHEHPTQALLDALTIRRNKGKIEGLTVAICGDILHSRVARSNILLLSALGARVRVVGPSTLLPPGIERMGVEVFRDMRAGLEGADIVMMLRLQRERMQGGYIPVRQGIFPLFRSRRGKAETCQARCAGHASRPDQPRRRNRFERRRWGEKPDPRAGRNGRRGADRRAGSLGAAFAEWMRAQFHVKHSPPPPSIAHQPLALINARLIDPAGAQRNAGGILVVDGVIRDVGAAVTPAKLPSHARIIDCGGDCVAPGLIDMRAFIGEPGAEHRETIATATVAAAAGGVTTILARSDTNPPVDEPAVVDFLLRRARDTGRVRVLPSAALTAGLKGTEIAEIGLLQQAGAVAFSDGARSVRNARVMRRVMQYARDFDALVIHYAEDRDLAAEGVMNEGEFASRLGLAGIPREAEAIMLDRDIRLVNLTGARYHAALVTTTLSLDIIAKAKADGLPVTCATSINHLTLNENDIGDYRTFLKLAPPLRGEDERRALVAGLASGLIDVVVSDHNPAGCRNQAPAVRRGGGWRDRFGDHALGGPAARSFGRSFAATSALPP